MINNIILGYFYLLIGFILGLIVDFSIDMYKTLFSNQKNS